MAQNNFRSAGVNVRVIDQTGATGILPTGTPAVVIGATQKGKAFVPVLVGTDIDFVNEFGAANNEFNEAPLASLEWLRNQQALNVVRVLGVGTGERRTATGTNDGTVERAGFVVGGEQPQYETASYGEIATNSYANAGVEGRLHFLGAVMSQSLNSTYFSDVGKAGAGIPVIRGVIMGASGVSVTLSSSLIGANVVGASNLLPGGSLAGDVVLSSGGQEFVMFLNGHKGLDSFYPNVVSGSFDPDAPNYFGKMLNRNPYKLEEAGYVLYADFPIHASIATVTGASALIGSAVFATREVAAFVITGSQARNVGTATVPNYENFEDRYRTPKTPWITSQKLGGKPENLFRFHAISDGEWANEKIKVSFSNITPGTGVDPYANFDVEIRAFDDDDKSKKTLEVFRRVNLNPDSTRFIAKIIGDKDLFYNWEADIGRQNIVEVGDYDSRSRYVRVEMAAIVTNQEIDASAVPFGFRGMPHFVTSGSAPMPTLTGNAAGVYDATVGGNDALKRLIQPPVSFRENLIVGASPNQTVDRSYYWGIQNTRKTNAAQPNVSVVKDAALNSFTKYYPDFMTSNMNMVVYDNEGDSDTTANGILDADRFNSNGFSLSNILLTYEPDGVGSANGPVTTLTMTGWRYVRAGGISANATAKTRELRTTDLTNPTVRQIAKFTTHFFGGFDGVRKFNRETNILANQAINEELDNTDRGLTEGPTFTSYDRAIDLISDAIETDYSIAAIPGIRNPTITDKALVSIEERRDAFVVFDIPYYDQSSNLYTGADDQYVSIQNTVLEHQARGLNSTYGAVFFPDIILEDRSSKTTRVVSPSVGVLGAIAYNDKIGYPWNAAAGFTRGSLQTTRETAIILNRQNMDDLLEARINPIASFPNSGGVVIWGQLTLSLEETALNRINVRRLLIELRRRLRPIANRIAFEPTVNETVMNFEREAEPIVRDIKEKRGVRDYLVMIDATTTTQQDLENKTIKGKIYVQPTDALEQVNIDFEFVSSI